jgi:DNA-binding transcriptional regulator YiaG
MTMTATAEIEIVAEARAALQSGYGRALRESVRLTQTEIAQACEVKPATISRWEGGSRLPSTEAAKRYGLLLRRLSELNQGVPEMGTPA